MAPERRGLLAIAAMVAVVVGFAALIGRQVQRVRRHELLPGHPGFYIYRVVEPPGGTPADQAPLELLVFGDSTAAGVGVDRPEDSLPVRLAELIAADRARSVRVLSYGWAGARAKDVVVDQLSRARQPLRPQQPGSRPPLPDATIVAISIGANDVIRGTAPAAFRRSMRDMLAIVRDAAQAEIVVAGLPRFRGALRQYEPLITIADAYGRILRRIQRDETLAAGARYADLATEVPRRLDHRTAALAADAFHPGPEIYRVWALVMAEALSAGRESPPRA